MIQLKWKLRLTPSYFGLTMILNQWAKNYFTGWGDLDSQGKYDYYSTIKEQRLLLR